MANTVLSCPFTLTESTSRVLWEVTGKCNLNCRHCLYFNNKKKPAPDLTFEEMVAILDNIARDGQIKAVWLSGGEPLLRKDLHLFAQEISKRGMVPSVSTNGTLLTDVLAEDLYEAGVRYVHLSIDGTTAAVHDDLRNTPGAFDGVMRGIGCLRRNNIRIGASYMVTWESVFQVPNMVTLALEKGLDVLSFYLVAPIGRGAGVQDSRELELMQALESVLKPYRSLSNLMIEVFRTVSEEQKLDSNVGLMECKGQCFYTITNDGYLSSCPWFAKNDSPVKPVNLKEMSFGAASQEIHKRMKQFLSNRQTALRETCVGCDHQENCGKGCPAVSSHTSNDPLCRYLK